MDTLRMKVRPGACERSRPASVVAGLWVTMLALSLFAASEVRAWVMHDRSLGAQPAAVGVANALVELSDLTRARQASEAVDEAVASAKPNVAWLRREREPVARGEPGDELADEAVTSWPSASGAGPSPARDPARAPLLSKGRRTERVLIIGASSIQLHFGAELERVLRSSYDGLTVERFGKLSTGLVRPDYFDWPEKTKELVADFRPDVVVAQFGGNDAQSIVTPRASVSFATPEWNEEFGKRVAELVGLARARGARFVMVGMPMMRDPKFSRRMQHLNVVMEKAVRESGGAFVPTWDLSAGADGSYAEAITVGGLKQLLRDTDGVHFSRVGAAHVAKDVAQRLEREVLLVPKAEGKAVVARREIASKAAGRRAPYLAFVPQPAARGDALVPALFLLHGADGGFADWADRAHESLQELADQHGLILVTPASGASGASGPSVDEVAADVDASLPCNGRRGIAAPSDVDHGALRTAIEHPSLFASVSSLGAEPARQHAEVVRETPMLVTAGAADPSSWTRALPRHVAWHAERLGAVPVRPAP